jgi:membrane protease YdiL (CAAX protease family)
MRYGKEFYNKYRNYILFNKNIIIAGTAALIVGILFTQMYAQHNKNNFLNSIVTLSVEYAIYIPLFALFFYFDNKARYVNPSNGKKNYTNIKNDIIKLFTIFSISEIVYSISKVSVHFQLMQISFEPYQASIIGSFTAWIIFLVIINFGAKIVKLFKDRNS